MLCNSDGEEDLEQARRLAAAAAAAAWTQRALPLGSHRWGTAYSSEAEWRMAVNRQRDAAAPAALLIHEVLQRLRDAVRPSALRPPANVPPQDAHLRGIGGAILSESCGHVVVCSVF